MADPYLTPNPQLPQHPLGAYTDSVYEAEQAQLEQEIQQRYANILQQLGYLDPATGKYIRGLVEIGADRQRNDLGHQLELARQSVDQQSQRDQTMFSGYRGTQIAQQEHPFVQALADLDVDVPQQLHSLWEQAGGLLGEYNTRNNLLLAEALGRRDPTDPGSGGSGDGGGGSAGVRPPGAGANIHGPHIIVGGPPIGTPHHTTTPFGGPHIVRWPENPWIPGTMRGV